MELVKRRFEVEIGTYCISTIGNELDVARVVVDQLRSVTASGGDGLLLKITEVGTSDASEKIGSPNLFVASLDGVEVV